MSKIQIIGIGDDGAAGLNEAARRHLAEADIVMGEAGLLQSAGVSASQQVVIGGNLDLAVKALQDNADRRVVMLAAGDPLFYGTARYLCDQVGKEQFEVMPHVSSMQLAFARVKENWDDAYLANLATQPLERVVERIRISEKAGLFTTDNATPATIAAALLDRHIDYFQAYVCENLGSPDERVTQAPLSEMRELDFGPLNVMVLVRTPNSPDRPAAMAGRRLFGNPDEMFLQSKAQRGLLTPAEVRSIALAQLDLGRTSIVWDVGAGSGAVAIEAAQLASGGEVYAIEMSADDHGLIASNAERFGVENLVPVLGQAPQAWARLPLPDAVFIGGTGRIVGEITRSAWERLKPGGRIVVNVGSIENLAAVQQCLEQACGQANSWMIQISRGNPQFEQLRFEPLAPTFLVGARKDA